MMNFRIQRPFTSMSRRQEGSVSVLMVFALAAMALMAALVLDGGHMMLNKTRLQNAVDAAALSGAKTLSQVTGSVNSASATRTAALNTLTQNANATGNSELATAIGGNLGTFATVEFASSVYGPFGYPGPTNAKYVQVSVPNYRLTGYFWNFVQTFVSSGLGGKSVEAIATAGPSPASPCDLTPLMVCGDPTKSSPFGFNFGDLQVLKTAQNKNDSIGPGNFQLLDFGSGGSTVRDDLAGGISECLNVGDNVLTKPGNTAGPAVQGLNTRFGDYSGPLGGGAGTYPPDLVTSYSKPLITNKAHGQNPPVVESGGEPVTASDGNLYAGGKALLDYNDWRASSAACVAGSGTDCQSKGAFERRILKVVIGNCTGKIDGASSVPVLGFGCFFVIQPSTNGDASIFGQFVQECEGDNVPGPTPSTDSGPQVIQLYKTYRNDSGTPTPSTDS
jgi:Flp pilus assembly protein TadG